MIGAFNIERSAQAISAGALRGLLRLHGVDIELLREGTHAPGAPPASPTRDVYGNYAGTLQKDNVQQTDTAQPIRMLIAGNPYAEHNPSFDLGFEESIFAYAEYADIVVGDTVVIGRSDGSRFQFEVVGRQSLGLTQSVFTKYELSPNPLPTEDPLLV